MFTLSRIYYKLLNFPLSMLVKSKSIPENPIIELGLDTSFPIMYVLLFNSKADLLTLRSYLLIHNLPDLLNPLVIEDNILPSYAFIYDKYYMCNYYTSNEKFIRLFKSYVSLYRSNQNLDVQIVAVSVIFDRHPWRDRVHVGTYIPIFNSIKKILNVIYFGRDSFIRFSPFLSLREVVSKYGNDKNITKKLLRLARIYFYRQHLAMLGPRLFTIQDLFKKILSSKAIIYAIEDGVRNKKMLYNELQKSAIYLIKEISANFSYKMVRFADKILKLTWNRVYKGINVNNIDRIYRIINDGHAIVYIPCHRSHMDYLLLSYVLYHKGLVPPHIAAGINLNFWPIGIILRRLGAFFIRRTFKRNKLYHIVFREYLSELFNRGYSVEYFIEGGRSRTGHLLNPKTGTLSMTIQTLLRSSSRPITLVPIYIGYEHIIEEETYAKELRGSSKEKENLLQLVRSVCKLRNLGKGYVNFGKPLKLITWLNQSVPDWRKSIDRIDTLRPIWLMRTVNSIATDIMVRINNASAANAINLCCTALLASHQFFLTRKQLTDQIQCYLDLMKNVPYSSDSTMPSVSASELIDYALQTGKFEVKKVNVDEEVVVILPRDQAIFMTYYRNNITHMLILPSMIATIIKKHFPISRMSLLHNIRMLYPMLKAELFLRWNNDEVLIETNKLINEFLRQGMILLKKDKIFIDFLRFQTLHLLSESSREILQRYAVTFWFISTHPRISRDALEKKSCMLIKKLAALHNDDTLGFFDKKSFNALVLSLRNEGYLSLHNEGYVSNIGSLKIKQTLMVYRMLSELINPEIRLEIESVSN